MLIRRIPYILLLNDISILQSLCGKLALTEAHSSSKLKELVLYEGSLADADRRLCDFDVATCIEVATGTDFGRNCDTFLVLLFDLLVVSS